MSAKITNASPAFYVDDDSYPGYTLVVLQHDSVESYMFKQDDKQWPMNMIGLYMFPNSFGNVITEQGGVKNNADWANSICEDPAIGTTSSRCTHDERIDGARYMMRFVPQNLNFNIIATDTSKCHVIRTSGYQTTIQDIGSKYTMRRLGASHIVRNDVTGDTITIVPADSAFGPNNTKFIIGGQSCSATIDGKQVVVALTDDTLVVTDCESHEFKMYKLGAAIVMLYRIMFVHAACAPR